MNGRRISGAHRATLQLNEPPVAGGGLGAAGPPRPTEVWDARPQERDDRPKERDDRPKGRDDRPQGRDGSAADKYALEEEAAERAGSRDPMPDSGSTRVET